MGFPFITGFFSKEIIYYFLEDSIFNFLLFYIRIISIGFTSIYIFRVSFYVYSSFFKINSIRLKLKNLGQIEKSIILLGICGIFLGWIFNEGLIKIICFRVINFYENFYIILIIIS